MVNCRCRGDPIKRKRANTGSPAHIQVEKALFAEAIVGVVIRADIEPRIFRVLQGLSFFQLFEPMHGKTAHFEGPLADLTVRQAFLQLRHLHVKGVSGQKDELL